VRRRWKLFFPTLLTLFTAATLAAQEKPKSLLEGLEASLPVEALHQVQPTDNLHLLAAYYYRDARQWRRIFHANRETMTNPNLIYINQIVRILNNNIKGCQGMLKYILNGPLRVGGYDFFQFHPCFS